MTDGLTPEEDDDDLRRRLLAGTPEVGGDSPLAELRPRFERARRRRRAARTAATTALASVVVVVAILAGGNDGTGRVRVTDDGPAGVPRVTATTAPPSTTVTTVVATTVPSTSAVTTAPAAATTSADVGGAVPTTTLPEGTPTPTSVTPTAAPGGTRTVDAESGSVTVTWTPTTLLVDAVTPAPGWEPGEVDRKEATRVVVHFRRVGGSSGPGAGEVTIDLRVEDGDLRVG